MDELRNWVKEQYLVKLLVMSSYEASTLLSNIGLSPDQLLQPFCEISHSFSLKSLTKTLGITSLKLQICEKLELKRNDSILTGFSPKINWEGRVPEVQNYLTTEHTPWFHAWKDDFFKSLHFSQHELIDMPLGIIYMASTTDTDPLQTFQALSRPQGLPAIYQAKVYDSNVPKIFILLHDSAKSSMTNGQTSALYDKIQRALSPNLCYLQTVSSEGVGTLIWEENKESSALQKEKMQLQMIMNEILVRAVVPYVETKLKEHDIVLEQKKRGIKNSIMKMFKTKPDKSDSFAYQAGCIEYSCRHLADLAFLFGDYEEALSHYKSVIHDLKGFKAWAHAGSACEMMGLCTLFLTGDLKETEYIFDTAYSYYQKAGDQAFLVRSLLLARQVFTAPEYAKKLALKLINSSNDIKDIKTVYPLFMEQTALCYLSSNPCYYRKYAFYQVIAGDEYRKLELVQNALHCYYSASHIYKGLKWDHVDMHIQHMLGRFCYFLNLQIESVHFFINLVASPKLLQQRDQHQKKIMNELFATAEKWVAMPVPLDYNPITKNICKFHSDGKPIIEFSLPKISSHSIVLPQDKVYSNGKAAGMVQLWRSLIGNDSKLSESFRHFDGENVKSWKRMVYCGEDVEIIVKCTNPLGYPLVVEEIEAILQHESEEFIVTKQVGKLELAAFEEKTIVLQSRQEKPGKVELKMLKWNMSNVFYGVFKFPSQSFAVAPAVSGLAVQILNFPERLLEGQVKNLQIKLGNYGENPLTNIVLTVSHSFLFGKTSVNIEELAAGTENTLEMWMRGERIGLHTIRLVLTYTSASETRYSRLQFTLEVKPSLKISSNFDFSLKEIDESVLSLVIRPAMQARLTIKQISSLSGHNLRLIKDIASEVYYIGVKKGLHNEISFDGDWVEQVDIRAGFCWDVKNILKQSSSEAALDLLLSWELESQDETVNGHHYLLDLQVPCDKKKKPLQVVLLAPTSVQHDFLAKNICQIPVKFSVKNISEEILAAVFIQALQEEEKGLVWVGNTSKKILNMVPGTIVDLDLFANFQHPGCYNLNRFSLKVDEIVKDLPRHLHQILIS